MDLLRGYGLDSEDEVDNVNGTLPEVSNIILSVRSSDSSDKRIVSINPDIAVRSSELIQSPENALLKYTPAEAQEVIPLHGPLKPNAHNPSGLYKNRRNQELGHIIVPPEKQDQEKLAEIHDSLWAAQLVRDAEELEFKRRKIEKDLELPPLLNERVTNNDPSSEEFLGPWAPYKGEAERQLRYQELMKEHTVDETKALSKITQPLGSKADDTGEIKQFVFHGKSNVDYQGRSWISGPVASTVDVERSTFPKTVVHTYVGHRKPALRQEFIPRTEHLLLTCSMDNTCKIWDVFQSRECLATYTGHSKGVKDIGFNHDGTRFYSCAMDNAILEWDTECGQIISSMGNGKLPFSLCVHPEQDNIIVCGHQNKMAVQYDARSGDIVQQYNEHLAAVNTATFCDRGRKVVTTSEDKRILVWEYGINVVMKHIAEPYMSSIPSVTLDPKKEFMACQSMDNQIVLYEAVHRFRLQSRRKFKGHTNTGYAIKSGFSPDSRFLSSGDVHGNLWLWDYASSKVVRSYQNSGHTGPLMTVTWNKKLPSLLATCGWDGKVKLWE